MTSDRIDELLLTTAYPESHSVRQVMLQVWNEIQQDFNKKRCPSCKWFQPMGEQNNDLCNNTSGSSHPVEFASADFGCNRWESNDLNTYIFQANRRTISHGVVQFEVQAKSELEAEHLFHTGNKHEIDSHIESTWNDDTKAELINTSK